MFIVMMKITDIGWPTKNILSSIGVHLVLKQ